MDKREEMERANRLYRENTPQRRKSDPASHPERVSDIVEGLRAATDAFAAIHESLTMIYRRLDAVERRLGMP